MAADIKQIIANLTSFYDFADKIVIHAGAGGGKITDYAHLPRKIYAVDKDTDGINILKNQIKDNLYKDKFLLINEDFCKMQIQCDVVFFEFCLHEMENPGKALVHAQTLAPEILIIDHDPKSEWSYYACETEKLTASWSTAIEKGIKSIKTFNTVQRFKDYNELFLKLNILGDESIRRIEKFKSTKNIEIPMPYNIALL